MDFTEQPDRKYLTVQIPFSLDHFSILNNGKNKTINIVEHVESIIRRRCYEIF